jgi:NAD(P)-dependent dehydrogenase (short-subunit alcohol dehydrogenase family)
MRVFGTTRDPARLPASAPRVEWIALDVREDASVSRALAELRAAAGSLDALVANAGMGCFGSVEETSIERAREQFETNYFGTLRSVRAVLPQMREARRGRIAIVGSLAGRAPIPFQTHYSASKAATDALVFGLRNELAGSGVEVVLIEPGDIRTEFNDRTLWSETENSAYGERIRAAERAVRELLPRAPGPEVIAEVIWKALTARRPRARYAAGPDSCLAPIGKRLLPDRLLQRLVRQRYGC